MSARTLIEQEPNYAFVSARLLLNILRDEALSFLMPASVAPMRQAVVIDYTEYFPAYIRKAVALELVDKELGLFDLSRMAARARPEPRWNLSSSLAFRPSTTATSSTRAASGLSFRRPFFHARRHGPRGPRDRPRSQSDRVLPASLQLRLHVLHPHALQRRNPAPTALLLLPHHH